MSSFDTARDLRLPGIKIERVYIDPSKLTTRMKNSVKAMIRSGVLKGGWNSKAKQLAQKLAEGSDVLVLSTSGRGFYAPDRHTYSDAVAEEICGLVDADEALELMEDTRAHQGSPYMDAVTRRTRERHEETRRVVRLRTYGRWCWMYSDELTAQVAQVFATTRSPKQIKAAEKLCDTLDRNEPIPITLSN